MIFIYRLRILHLFLCVSYMGVEVIKDHAQFSTTGSDEFIAYYTPANVTLALISSITYNRNYSTEMHDPVKTADESIDKYARRRQ